MLNVDVRMCIVTALELVTSYNVVHSSSRSNTSQYLIYWLKLGSGVGWRRNNCHFENGFWRGTGREPSEENFGALALQTLWNSFFVDHYADV